MIIRNIFLNSYLNIYITNKNSYKTLVLKPVVLLTLSGIKL